MASAAPSPAASAAPSPAASCPKGAGVQGGGSPLPPIV